MVQFVTSWDDGHPNDERVADMLAKYGLRGTFFVPCYNVEGREVMDAGTLRRISDAGFEIGGHTRDHVFLPAICPEGMDFQIAGGKDWMEQQIGRRTESFCYPGGYITNDVIARVRGAGYKYGRTIENFRFDLGDDPLLMPTSVQFFPHRRGVLLRNLMKWGWSGRALNPCLIAAVLSGGDYVTRALRLVDFAAGRSGGVFHLWGHSHELGKYDLWQDLDCLLRAVAELKPVSATVSEAAHARFAAA